MNSKHPQAATLDGAQLIRSLNGYRIPSSARSSAELGVTLIPLALLWSAAWFVFWLGYTWATPLFAIPAAGFLVRLFMIQHDGGLCVPKTSSALIGGGNRLNLAGHVRAGLLLLVDLHRLVQVERRA